MNIIILAAGIGSRLYPLTKDTPKCLLKVDHQTILEKTLNNLKLASNNSNLHKYIVVGFEHEKIKEVIPDCIFIHNPFFRKTNSIASLWFANDLLTNESIIINADVCLSKEILEKVFQSKLDDFVICDSSKKCTDADYKIVVQDEHITDMGKILPSDNYLGEYAGLTKLSQNGAILLKHEIKKMVLNEQYDTWYETALVNIIKEQNFKLSYLDIASLPWIELDSIKDFDKACTFFK
jgi:choline kinase